MVIFCDITSCKYNDAKECSSDIQKQLREKAANKPVICRGDLDNVELSE